eukprot:5615206-Karenia_brevis.AAC.1
MQDPDDTSKEASSSLARSTRAHFVYSCTKPDLPYNSRVDAMPPIVYSDNTVPAVAVTKHLRARISARCAIHVLYIPIRRMCFPKKTVKGARYPR